MSDPAAILKGLGEPTRGVLKPLYRSEELTILNIVWAPYMTLQPHNHNMWGVIGIYTGREDNIIGGACRAGMAGSKPPAQRRLVKATLTRWGETSSIRSPIPFRG